MSRTSPASGLPDTSTGRPLTSLEKTGRLKPLPAGAKPLGIGPGPAASLPARGLQSPSGLRAVDGIGKRR